MFWLGPSTAEHSSCSGEWPRVAPAGKTSKALNVLRPQGVTRRKCGAADVTAADLAAIAAAIQPHMQVHLEVTSALTPGTHKSEPAACFRTDSTGIVFGPAPSVP